MWNAAGVALNMTGVAVISLSKASMHNVIAAVAAVIVAVIVAFASAGAHVIAACLSRKWHCRLCIVGVIGAGVHATLLEYL